MRWKRCYCRYFSYISPKEERSQVIRHPFFARCFCKKQEMICREKSMRGSCSGRVVKLLRKSKQKHRLQKKSSLAGWVAPVTQFFRKTAGHRIQQFMYYQQSETFVIQKKLISAKRKRERRAAAGSKIKFAKLSPSLLSHATTSVRSFF